jgi:hypothetical protein
MKKSTTVVTATVLAIAISLPASAQTAPQEENDDKVWELALFGHRSATILRNLMTQDACTRAAQGFASTRGWRTGDGVCVNSATGEVIKTGN